MIAFSPKGKIFFRNTPLPGSKTFPCHTKWFMKFAMSCVKVVPGKRRITRVRRDVAGAARYADPIVTDELVVVVVAGIVHETIAISFVALFLVKLRIWKKPKTEHT